jgi:hypothetical protein
LGDVVRERFPIYTWHGVIMWFAWTLISILQVATNRYLKHKWQLSQKLHTVLGLLAGAFTITAVLLALSASGWVFYFDHLHNLLGFIFMIVGMLLVLGGLTALLLRSYTNYSWKSNNVIFMQKMHSYFGYIVILGA